MESDDTFLSLSWNGMMKIQRSETRGLWNTTKNKPYLLFTNSIHSQILFSTLEQNALEYNGTHFPPNDMVITQLDS